MLRRYLAVIITHVVVLVLWSIKNGLPLGACRTSQPLGRNPCSISGCWLEDCCDESPDVACGCLAIEVFCAAGNWPASIAIYRQKKRNKKKNQNKNNTNKKYPWNNVFYLNIKVLIFLDSWKQFDKANAKQ